MVKYNEHFMKFLSEWEMQGGWIKFLIVPVSIVFQKFNFHINNELKLFKQLVSYSILFHTFFTHKFVDKTPLTITQQWREQASQQNLMSMRLVHNQKVLKFRFKYLNLYESKTFFQIFVEY